MKKSFLSNVYYHFGNLQRLAILSLYSVGIVAAAAATVGLVKVVVAL